MVGTGLDSEEAGAQDLTRHKTVVDSATVNKTTRIPTSTVDSEDLEEVDLAIHSLENESHDGQLKIEMKLQMASYNRL